MLDVSLDTGVATLRFTRPEVLNAFDDRLGAETLDAVRSVSGDEGVRCVVLTGTGRAFCSGEDLGALAEGYSRGDPADLGRILRERYNPLIRAILAAPKPVMAALNGVAAGAGASIALACDVRIASAEASLVWPFVKVGLVPDSGALWFLTRTVGASRAWSLVADANLVTASEALQLGLVHDVVQADEFERRWRAEARRLASGPTRAYALTKALLARASELSLDEQLELEVNAQTEAGATRDHLEGVQAFLSKRPPHWQGR
ncbi:MAG: enoyl-CoA hydratase-related protein [Actinomycetota bacterium]|nr:enoyl-CoA hydratase-related protein [Actinomycetota bacterium]